MRKIGAALCLLLLWLMWGCGRNTAPAGPSCPTSDISALTLSVTTDKASYNHNENVLITFTIRNDLSQPFKADYSPPLCDYSVHSATAEIWRASYGRLYPAVIYQYELPAGSKEVHSETWGQKDNSGNAVPTGRYIVKAYLIDHMTPVTCTSIEVN